MLLEQSIVWVMGFTTIAHFFFIDLVPFLPFTGYKNKRAVVRIRYVVTRALVFRNPALQ
jgi:hypothetical protein